MGGTPVAVSSARTGPRSCWRWRTGCWTVFHGSGPLRRLRPDHTEFEAKKPVQNAPGRASARVAERERIPTTKLLTEHPAPAVPPTQDLHEICTKRFISMQISAFACIVLPLLLQEGASPKGLILLVSLRHSNDLWVGSSVGRAAAF